VTAGTVPSRRVGATARRDRWWLAPLLTATGLTAFGIYSIVVVATGTDYVYTKGGALYLSPFYSPDLKSWGLDLPFSYAFFVIWVPLGFRRHVLLLPQGVLPIVLPVTAGVRGDRAAAEPLSRRSGVSLRPHERPPLLPLPGDDRPRLPGLRRGARLLLPGSDGSLHLGVGVGTLVLVANVVLLAMFTFGCNSLGIWSVAGSTASRAPPPRRRGTSSTAA
jgi:hypothetical protein